MKEWSMFLITGATGTVGRPLVESLAGAPVRAVSRSAPDFTGVTAVFLNPRAVGSAAASLLARAKDAGVRRVVVLAAINVDEPLEHQPSRFNGDRNKEVEAAAIESGLEWVSLRPTYFAMNTAMAWGPQLRAGDVVHAPFPTAAEAPIDQRDIAAVAARALVSDDLLGQKLALTGPESLTYAEMAATIGRVLGRDVRFAEIAPEAAEKVMVERGANPGFAAALLARYAREEGKPAHVASDVEKVLGRPAWSYAEWVADHADLFARQ
jgi:uncharacterized protein YbjT (DUF2867 family)